MSHAPKSPRMPSVETLRAMIAYDPETGILTWKQRNRGLTGKQVGCAERGMKYRRVHLNGVMMLAHRVALAIHYGEWPQGQIDHINGDRVDNRLCNLRVVTASENLRNKRKYGNNKSGRVGVMWHKLTGKWGATISAHGEPCWLGTFDTKEAAIEAREAAERRLGFHENHGSM